MPAGDASDSPLETATAVAGARATEAFKLLGNETRLAILLALWTEYEPFTTETAIAFSELRERVGNPDSGQFNYHLGKLTDHFVLHTEHGYELSQAGFHVVSAVLAGIGATEVTLEPVAVDAECPLCDASVEVSFEQELVAARCTKCEGIWEDETDSSGLLFRFSLPPTALEDRTPGEIFGATLTYNFHRLASFRRGVCPRCAGTVDRTVDVCEDHDHGASPCSVCRRRHLSEVMTVCTRCKASIRDPAVMAALIHPAVTAFYHDHGVIHQFDSWEAFTRGQTLRETLVSTDPLRVRITIPCGGDELQVMLDEDANLNTVADSDPS